MENDQTWPTEEEIVGMKGNIELIQSDDIPDALPGTTPKKIVKRVPKGTSSYQAAWIIDSGSDDEYEDYTDEDGDVNMAYEKDEEKLLNDGGADNEDEE